MLIKAGERTGLPVSVSLTETELKLYETTNVAQAAREHEDMTQLGSGQRQLPPSPPVAGGYN